MKVNYNVQNMLCIIEFILQNLEFIDKSYVKDVSLGVEHRMDVQIDLSLA